MVSRIMDKILPIAKEWQRHPLEAVYMVVFLDAINPIRNSADFDASMKHPKTNSKRSSIFPYEISMVPFTSPRKRL